MNAGRTCSWLLLLCLISLNASAQFGAVYLGVNGLTCSQCTRNVEMRLRRLSFIADVQMDLQHTNGTIRLKDPASFDPAAVARAVKDAGFSVRYLRAALREEAGIIARSGSCFRIRQNNYQLVPAGDTLPRQAMLQFIGPGFLPSAELRPWRSSLVRRCGGPGTVYFVTAVKEEGASL